MAHAHHHHHQHGHHHHGDDHDHDADADADGGDVTTNPVVIAARSTAGERNTMSTGGTNGDGRGTSTGLQSKHTYSDTGSQIHAAARLTVTANEEDITTVPRSQTILFQDLIDVGAVSESDRFDQSITLLLDALQGRKRLHGFTTEALRWYEIYHKAWYHRLYLFVVIVHLFISIAEPAAMGEDHRFLPKAAVVTLEFVCIAVYILDISVQLRFASMRQIFSSGGDTLQFAVYVQF